MAGLTPAVASPFGNSGKNLDATIPDTDVGGVADIILGKGPQRASTQTPIAQPPPAAPEGEVDPYATLESDLDAQFAGLEADLGVAPEGEAPPAADDMSTMPAPEGMESVKEQFKESLTRMKNSFAVTSPESIQVLKQSGLFDDVRSQGGTLQVKRKGRGGWENFDRDKIELIGDTLDFTRDGIEAIVENAFRVGGGAGGGAGGTVVAPGPGTVAGGLAGASAAGAAGAVAAKNAGDYIALKLGIDRDPNRNRLTENAIAGAFGAGFTFMGSTIARRLVARRAAQAEAQKTVEYATEQVAETMKDIAEVKNSGIILGEHGNFRLDPQQMVGKGNVPELDVAAKHLSTEQGFRNFRKSVADSITNAYDSVAKTLGAAAGKGANIGEDFVLTAKDVRQAEGKLIGSFRKLADEKLAQAPQVAPRFSQTLEAMSMEMTDKVDDFALATGLPNEKAGQLMNMIKGYQARAAKNGGQFTLDEAEQLRKQIQSTIDSKGNQMSGLSQKLYDLRDAIRDDSIDMMGNVLPATQMENFAKAKGRYKTIMGATGELGRLLDNESISKNALLDKLFNGKGAYNQAMSAKTLIQETNPQLWNNLASEFFTKMRNEATDATGRNVNWGQITRKWRDLDPRLQTELLNTVGIKPEGMNALLQLGAKVQQSSFEAMPKEAQNGIIKRGIRNIFIAYGGGATAKGSAVGSMLDGMGKDQALAKWLKDGGMEEVLKEMPGLKPAKAAALRSWISSWTPRPVRAVGGAAETAIQKTAPVSARRSVETLGTGEATEE